MHWRNNHLLILLRNRSDTAKIFVGIFSTETIVFGLAVLAGRLRWSAGSEEQFARVTGYIESGKKKGANLGREDVSVARTNGGATWHRSDFLRRRLIGLALGLRGS